MHGGSYVLRMDKRVLQADTKQLQVRSTALIDVISRFSSSTKPGLPAAKHAIKQKLTTH